MCCLLAQASKIKHTAAYASSTTLCAVAMSIAQDATLAAAQADTRILELKDTSRLAASILPPKKTWLSAHEHHMFLNNSAANSILRDASPKHSMSTGTHFTNSGRGGSRFLHPSYKQRQTTCHMNPGCVATPCAATRVTSHLLVRACCGQHKRHGRKILQVSCSTS